MRHSDYRPDIDGLRALAVLPVVWFHSGLPGLPGGFTGVDTFFVISGFLISSIIFREVDAGTFSFSTFYQRRIRRIAPALLTVLATTLTVGAYLLLPFELGHLGMSAAAAIAMVPNIYLWRGVGYFAAADGITPLLHTWSLGVEEQFYLFFPFVLLIGNRFKITRSLVVGIAVTSFLLCIVFTVRSPSASFFLLPTRAWELMLGALIAIGSVRIPARAREAASVLGLLLLVSATLFIEKGNDFPGWKAAIPALGAMLIIGAGPIARINRMIANPAFIAIGKISYSLYLWHWPVFVFMRQFRADVELPTLWAVSGIVLSVLLAFATYVFIEQPPRRPDVSFRRVAVPALAVASILLVASTSMKVFGGFPGRFSPEVLALAKGSDDTAPLAKLCMNVPLDRVAQDCHIGPPGRAQFLLWGDSHAGAMSEAVGLGLQQPGKLTAFNACAPSLTWANSSLAPLDRKACLDRNKAILSDAVADPELKTVVLVAYWVAHDREGGQALWRSVQDIVNRLDKADKQVILIVGLPEAVGRAPWQNAINARFQRPKPKLACTENPAKVTGAIIVDLSSAFCTAPNPDELYVDTNHTSRTAGVQLISPALRLALQR